MGKSVARADETSVKVNGTKNWLHTYQIIDPTFIGYRPSRMKKAPEAFYPDGLPNTILVIDCLGMHLSTPAAAHHNYLAHLLRELRAMQEAHLEQCWPGKIKDFFLKAINLANNPYNKKDIKRIENKFERMIKTNQFNAPGKIPAFWKRMYNHSDKVFSFLHYSEVPSDNNASYPNF
jgi:hypothetical protein